jgi:hypothetical protein
MRPSALLPFYQVLPLLVGLTPTLFSCNNGSSSQNDGGLSDTTNGPNGDATPRPTDDTSLGGFEDYLREWCEPLATGLCERFQQYGCFDQPLAPEDIAICFELVLWRPDLSRLGQWTCDRSYAQLLFEKDNVRLLTDRAAKCLETLFELISSSGDFDARGEPVCTLAGLLTTSTPIGERCPTATLYTVSPSPPAYFCANGRGYCDKDKLCRPLPDAGEPCTRICVGPAICPSDQELGPNEVARCRVPGNIGDPCIVSSACSPSLACLFASSSATSGTCQPPPTEDQACGINNLQGSICASHLWCVDGKCQSPTPTPVPEYRCVPRKTQGEVCLENRECSSDMTCLTDNSRGGNIAVCGREQGSSCSQTLAFCPPDQGCFGTECRALGDPGQACDDSSRCRAPAVCGPDLICALPPPPPGPGEACSGTCVAGASCFNGRCEPVGAPGQLCNESGTCTPPAYCAPGNICMLPPVTGEICDYVCAEGNKCDRGICVPLRAPGEACSSIDYCVSDAVCVPESGDITGCTCGPGFAGRCVVPDRNEGDACDWTRLCRAELACVSGRCLPIGAQVGESCVERGCAAGLSCQRFKCVPTAGAECQIETCGSDAYCAITGESALSLPRLCGYALPRL